MTASWSERELDTLQRLLDAVPAPLEPLDVVMLDGFLCGVLLQPEPGADRALVASCRRCRGACPAGRVRCGAAAAPRRAPSCRTRPGHRRAALVRPLGVRARRRPGERRCEAATTDVDPDDDPESRSASEAVYPWVAGFATALEFFPGLMRLPARTIDPPLALIYRHLQPDDLEDAEALLAEIESLEPAVDLRRRGRGAGARDAAARRRRPAGPLALRSPAGRRRSPSAAPAVRHPCARGAARAGPAARARGSAAGPGATATRAASACARRRRCGRSPSAPARRR